MTTIAASKRAVTTSILIPSPPPGRELVNASDTEFRIATGFLSSCWNTSHDFLPRINPVFTFERGQNVFHWNCYCLVCFQPTIRPSFRWVYSLVYITRLGRIFISPSINVRHLSLFISSSPCFLILSSILSSTKWRK